MEAEYAVVKTKNWESIQEEMLKEFPKNFFVLGGASAIDSNDRLSEFYISQPIFERGEDSYFGLHFRRRKPRGRGGKYTNPGSITKTEW
jgi:hypothetical protein